MYGPNHTTVLVSYGCCNTVPNTVKLKNNRNLLSHSSGGWKSKTRVSSVPCSFWCAHSLPREEYFLFLLASSVRPRPLAFFHLSVHHSSHTVIFSLIVFRLSSSVHVCLHVQISPFYRVTNYIWLGFAVVASGKLDYLHKDSIST